MYTRRSANRVTVHIQRQEHSFEVLHYFEFDSDRKRASIVIRAEGCVLLLTKGADSIIKARLSKTREQPFLDHINQELEFFSAKGLRTLCLAMRVLSENDYNEYANKIQACIGLAN